jgi:importin-5
LLILSISQTRSFAAVIFRRIASKARKLPSGETTELFLSLPQEEGYIIRSKLLEALGAEGTNAVRNKIGDAVAEIAREYSDASTFLPLLSLLGFYFSKICKTDAG